MNFFANTCRKAILRPLSILLFWGHFAPAQSQSMLVKDINTGSANSNPRNFTTLGNLTFFFANESTGGKIYQSDGTTVGTKPIPSFGTSTPNTPLITWNNQVYFVTTSLTPTQMGFLYRTDGTTTTFVDTLFNSGTGTSSPIYGVSGLEVRNNQLYYNVRIEGIRDTKTQLYAHNGLRNGSKSIAGVEKSVSGTGSFFTSSSKVFYGASTFYVFSQSSGASSAIGNQLDVVRNVTPVTTRNIFNVSWQQFSGPPASYGFAPLGVIGNLFYAVNKDTLVRYDSTGLRTVIETGLGTPVGDAQQAGNSLYFRNGNNQIWRTDGTAAGTIPLTVDNLQSNEIFGTLYTNGTDVYVRSQTLGVFPRYRRIVGNTVTINGIGSGSESSFSEPFFANGKLYFTFNPNTSCPVGLNEYNPTTNTANHYLIVAQAGAQCSYTFGGAYAIAANNVLLYSLNDNINGIELWKVDLNPSVSTAICSSKSLAPWELWTSNVRFGTINNTSDKFKDFATLGYSDYTNLTTTVSKGQTYPLSITPSLSWIGNLPNVYCRAWIDFNDNKTFEANEIVLERNGVNPLTGNVLVPTAAVIGNVRMRVATKWGAYPTACEAFDRGEVEGYTITIQGGGTDPCLTDITPPVFQNCPANITQAISGQRAFITWTNPTATDNCTAQPVVFPNIAPPFSFEIGITEVLYTAEDAKGNRSYCRFNVTLTQNPTTILPDLTLSNAQMLNTQVRVNDSLFYSVTAANTTFGSTPATTIFFMQTYFSRDSVLSGDDIPANERVIFGQTIGKELYRITRSWSTIPNTLAGGDYYLIFKIDNINVVLESNENNNVTLATTNGSATKFTVIAVPPTTGNTADIAVSLASTPSVFSPFSTLAMAIGAKNVGTQAMTNVKIEFKYPAGTVSGGTAVSSVGTWQEWCAGGVQCFTWTIPSLAANATATLNLPLYVLNPTSPIIAVAKLLGSMPTDGNAANNTATLTINKATSPTQLLIAQRPTQLVPIVFQKIAPNPVADEMTIQLESIDDREVVFQLSDAVGKTVRIENRNVGKGMNRVVFDVSSLLQGLYLIQTNVGKGRGVPTKFIKM